MPLILFIVLFISFNNASADNSPAALQMEWRDTSISPAENYYAHANGNWLKNNPIPAKYSSWGTFNILNEKMQQTIHQLVSQAAADKKAVPGSLQQKVGDFYYSGMNEALIDKLGISPLQPQLEEIAAMKDIKELPKLLASLHLRGMSAFFYFGSMQNFKNSREMIGAGFQGGLGLPDRDYYLKEDSRFKQIRAAYEKHIARMFVLMGDKPAGAARQAAKVMQLETSFAKASLSQTAQRDPHAIYHMMTLAELQNITPDFSWPLYFNTLGLTQISSINMAMPEFFKNMNQQLRQVPLDEWKTYLRWHLIDSFAPFLSKDLVEQDFRMSAVLSGTKEMMPRWQRVVGTENGALDFAIGKLYVEKYFSAADKKQVLTMVHNIREALRKDIKVSAWMTPATRRAALKKLSLMEERVGYPDKWWDYSTLKISRDSYLENIVNSNIFQNHRDLNKIDKPVDRSEWNMSPQTINAYYNPSMNNINIPAGILQPPFFDASAPAAINYGAIGFVIGHEMTHGFDDQGAQFDGYGNLNNWWTAEDLKKFQAATSCIAEQFSQYTVADGLKVQGRLVMGEATADLGGLTLAYRAYHASEAYKNAKVIAGLTPDQQFFLGAAHVWAGSVRPEQERNLVTTDPHPPLRYRVNGTLANMPEFQSAFTVLGNSPMVNKNRCIIW